MEEYGSEIFEVDDIKIEKRIYEQGFDLFNLHRVMCCMCHEIIEKESSIGYYEDKIYHEFCNQINRMKKC